MLSFFTAFFAIALLFVSGFTILLVLMQRSPEGGGFGSSLGGNAMESIFGGDAGDVLVRTTAKAIGAFFLLSFLLALCYVHRGHREDRRATVRLPVQIAAISQGSADK